MMMASMNRSLLRQLTLAACAASLLCACQTTAPATKAPTTKAPASPRPAAAKPPLGSPGNPAPVAAVSGEAQGLREGIDLYDKGAYNEAIKRLAAPEVAGGSRATQLKALKFTAFSYCLTARAAQCRTAFDKAFKLDPAFALEPGENGHPLWTPSYTRAKKAAGR